MPLTPTYPGVYVQEAPSLRHAISGVPTANTAFVDVFERGPVDRPQRITSFAQFVSTFGKPDHRSKASHGISQFFENGGGVAWVVRIHAKHDATASGTTSDVALDAIGPGTWGNRLQVATQAAVNGGFDLVVRELSDPSTSPQTVINVETYAAVDSSPDGQNYVGDAIAASRLVSLGATQPQRTPGAKAPLEADSILNEANYADVECAAFVGGAMTGGRNDLRIGGASDLGAVGDPSEAVPPTGLYTLGSIAPEMFNLLCIPAMAAMSRSEWMIAYTMATDYCQTMSAFMIVDPPIAAISSADEGGQVHEVQAWWADVLKVGPSDHAAAYFPRIEIPDPATGDPMETESSGTLAGIYAASDATRRSLEGAGGRGSTAGDVIQPVVRINDIDNGTLNQIGINCLRTFPVIGTVSWGARTVAGGDLLDSQWKYINVRRLALYIEASLELGTRWAVFEPNAEPLWDSLRVSVASFMDTLFKQGAFAGSSAKNSYFVACDASTTTALDVEQGRLNFNVGFAPMYPAEFVVITFSRNVHL